MSVRALLMRLCAAILLPCLLLGAAASLSRRSAAEDLELVRESVRRAAVQCYAIEGAYPVSLDELRQRYGLSVDTGRYFVDYSYVAANLMPDITVLERGD